MKIFVTIICAVLLQRSHLASSPCIPTFASRPVFSPPMTPFLPLEEGRLKRLHCCMYGVTQIEWTFSKEKDFNSPKVISSQQGLYTLEMDNRTVIIERVTYDRDTGFYRCQGWSDDGQTLTGVLRGKVLRQNGEFNLKIVNWSNTSSMTFQERSSHTLYCTATVNFRYNPDFIWNRVRNNRSTSIIKNGFLNTDLSTDSLVEGYNGSSQLTELLRSNMSYYCIYNMTLTLTDLNSSHQGLYSCEVNVHSSTIQETLYLSIKPPSAIPTLVLIGVSSWFIASVFLLYVFRYETKVLTKRALRVMINRKCIPKKYDYFFLYNFSDQEEFKTIQKVVTSLDALKLSSYFHHRDQTYGRDSLESFCSCLKDCSVVVVWLTTSFFDSPLSVGCMQILLKTFSNIQRVYVMNGKKSRILAYCNSKAVISDLSSFTTSRVFKLDPNASLSSSDSNLLDRWRRHRFLTWLASHLPLFPACYVYVEGTKYKEDCV